MNSICMYTPSAEGGMAQYAWELMSALAEHPRPCKRHQETLDCELELLGEKYGLLEPLRQRQLR